VESVAAELADAWVDGDPGARWRSGSGVTGEASGSSGEVALVPGGERERQPLG
jgi:hypothetical protein